MAGDPSGNRLIIFSMAAFQSAPAIDGGRSQPRLARLYRLHQFQSAPAIDGGRSGCQTSHRPGISSFNPRPPSMAGDPLHARHHCHAGWVSIRARHRWRAIRLYSGFFYSVLHVSIRARHRWRAIRFARNSLLSNHIFDVQREHDDQAHLVARRRHKSTDQFQQTQ